MTAHRLRIASLLLGFLATLAAGLPSRAEDKTVRIAFKPGASSATVSGQIKGYDGIAYTLDVAAGQTLRTGFRPSNPSCYVNVSEPGSDAAVFNGSIDGNAFSRSPTVAGTYRIVAYLMRNAARRNEVCRFTLAFEVTNAPGAAGSIVTDDAMQGRCKAAAAQMYGIEPRRITPGSVAPDGGSFRIDATADKGKEGIKKLRCLFRADRMFDHIMAMTPDGE